MEKSVTIFQDKQKAAKKLRDMTPNTMTSDELNQTLSSKPKVTRPPAAESRDYAVFRKKLINRVSSRVDRRVPYEHRALS